MPVLLLPGASCFLQQIYIILKNKRSRLQRLLYTMYLSFLRAAAFLFAELRFQVVIQRR